MKDEIESYNSKKTDNNDFNKKPKLFIMTEPNFYKKNIFSKTMKNINDLTLKKKKVKRFSVNIRNELIKKMEKKPKVNERQIYTPLYIQIHKSLKDIEHEKRIAKNYILSEKEVITRIKIPLYNSIFQLNQKNNLLLNLNNNEEKLNGYYVDNKSKGSSDIFRKLSNTTKNTIISNNSINNKFLKSFSGKLNNKKVIFRNKIKNKTFTDSILNFGKNLSNLASPTNSSGPLIPITPMVPKKTSLIFRTDSKETVNKNLSSINRTNTNTNIQTLKSLEDKDKNINKMRNKTFFVEYEPDWYSKNKFIKNRIDKNMITNPLFQKKIIDDELALIFGYMKIFQSQYLIDKNLSKYFIKISYYSQKGLNLYLEEAIGLLTEISYLLLNGYENIIQNFISNPIERITKKKVKNIFDEKKEFMINISTFSETYIFLQVCYEAYTIISNGKDDYYITKNNFKILNQFLDRARFVVSKICLDLNNMYREQNKEDKKIIEDCLKNIKNVNRKAYINNLKIVNNHITTRINFKKKKFKSKVDCHLKFGLFKSGIDSFRYKGPKKLKLSEEHLTNLRINKAFGASSYRDLKPHKHIVKFDINSSLVNQLMKYATNEFKSKIISERIRQRYITPDIN